jgi:hypothetical protein
MVALPVPMRKQRSVCELKFTFQPCLLQNHMVATGSGQSMYIASKGFSFDFRQMLPERR